LIKAACITGSNASNKVTPDGAASIDKVLIEASDFSAFKIRPSSTMSNPTKIMNNESDVRSRILDTDYAEEASNLSAQSIVQ